MPDTPWPPRWFIGAIVIFGVALALGAVGPDWLTPLLVTPAGALIVHGAWPYATGRQVVPPSTMFGWSLSWIGRVWGAVGVLVGGVWAVSGTAGFVQQVA